MFGLIYNIFRKLKPLKPKHVQNEILLSSISFILILKLNNLLGIYLVIYQWKRYQIFFFFFETQLI